jgi:DNA helicase B
MRPSQCSGSEADNIVYVLSGSPYETWQHVYTAVTRGKKHVIIIGTYAELEQAVKY